MPNDSNGMFEAMLKEAVTADFQNEMKKMPSEEELLREYPPSAEHIRRMNVLFAGERRRTRINKTLSFTKAAIIVLCVTATLFLTVLMFNSQIRAAVWNAIVKVWEGFTSIEFTETGTQTKKVTDFTIKYIPNGYTLNSIDEYGDNRLSIYEDAEGNILMLDVGPAGTHEIDIEYREYITKEYANVTYYIFEAVSKEHYSGIIWEKDGASFQIDGVISIDELLKIARSVE